MSGYKGIALYDYTYFTHNLMVLIIIQDQYTVCLKWKYLYLCNKENVKLMVTLFPEVWQCYLRTTKVNTLPCGKEANV